MHVMVSAYVWFVLAARRVASLLKNLSHSIAIPPEVEKTSGVKVACSVLIILALYIGPFLLVLVVLVHRFDG